VGSASVTPLVAHSVGRAPPRAAALWGIAVAGAALAAGELAIALSSDASDLQVALLLWITVPYIAAGLVAWWRRPDTRLGVLMIAGGFAIGLSALQLARHDVLYTIGAPFDILPAALFLHVYLAFPSGRLRTTFERVLVGAAYAAAIGLQIVKASLGGMGSQNLLEISFQPSAAEAVERVQLVSLSVFCLAGIGVLAARRRRGERPHRRSLALLVDSFAVALVMVALLFLFGAFQGPAFVEIQRATLIVLGISPIVFLIGLLDARLARSAVGDLMIELRAEPAPADLRDSLARALHDPTLRLVYWLPEYGRYVDLDGSPADVADEPGRSMAVIDRGSEPVAALIHDSALDDEPELLDAVGAAAAMALENARLQVELAARLEEVRGSRARVIQVGQRERERLERNLHDGAQQRLVALSLELSLLAKQVREDPEAGRRLDRAQREIAHSLEELRDVAHGLHPAVLTAHGLEVALEQVAARAPVPVRLRVEVDGRLAEPVEVAAYYVVTESLANVAKHAQATSASVSVEERHDSLVVEIVDNGVGGADTERGTGLRGLADRVEALGGRLRVWTPLGKGTRVRAEIPCA